MNTRQDELGRILRQVLEEEADTMQVDTRAALASLERRLTRHRRVRRPLALAVACTAAAAVVAIGLAQGGSAPSEDRPDPGPAAHPSTPHAAERSSPMDPRGVASRPFFLEVESGKRTPVPNGLVPDSLGANTGHDTFRYDVSPDGERVAYNCHGGDVGCLANDAIAVSALDGTHARSLRLEPPYATDRVVWSPDGEALAYHVHMHGGPQSGGLFIQDVSSDRGTQLVDFPEEFGLDIVATSADFSADGTSVLFDLPAASPGSSEQWNIWSVPVTGGEPIMVLSDAAFPMPLPDGSGIAFLDNGAPYPSSTIQMLDAKGSRSTIVEANASISRPAMSPDGTHIAYNDGPWVMVVDVSTGVSSRVIAGTYAVTWADDATLLLADACDGSVVAPC